MSKKYFSLPRGASDLTLDETLDQVRRVAEARGLAPAAVRRIVQATTPAARSGHQPRLSPLALNLALDLLEIR